MGTLDLPNSVVHIAACAHHSRLGSQVGASEGVSQFACSGKYSAVTLLPLSHNVSHWKFFAQLQPTTSRNALCLRQNVNLFGLFPLPRRIVESIMEDSNLPNPVLPYAASDHHSRLGPVVGGSVGVLQNAYSGKYLYHPNQLSPECVQYFSDHHVSAAIGTYDITPGRTVDSTQELPERPNPVVTAFSQPSESSLNIYYQNAGGMNGCIEEYLIATNVCSYYIIALTETWLNNSVLSQQTFGSDYDIIRYDRS